MKFIVNVKPLQEECNGLLALENSTLILKEQTTQHFLRYEKTQSDYEEVKRLFFAGQAGMLAAKLKSESAVLYAVQSINQNLQLYQGKS